MTLILIDAKNALYRFGYGMPKLRSGSGLLTGAVHGFLQMLLRLKKKYPDGRFIIAWDGPAYRKLGWRKQIYPEYKQRGESNAPPQLTKALPIQEVKIKEICNLIGLTQTALDEIEADDIIGVLAAKYAGEYSPVIYSTDKDFIQLMPLGVTLIRDTGKKRMTPETPTSVVALFRCYPKDVLKVRAIVGDKSDNIPKAVHGVAAVGAAKLIAAGADPTNEHCKIGRAWNSDAWGIVHRNYRIMRILQSVADFELNLEQRRALDREVTRIAAHLYGKIQPKRTQDHFRAFLRKLADLDLQEAIESRQELWSLDEISTNG